MTIRCFTCSQSFDVGDKEILYDNGSDLAVYRHEHCGTMYLAVADDKAVNQVLLFKLTKTKSFVTSKEESRVIKPVDARLILTPGEAAAEAKRIMR